MNTLKQESQNIKAEASVKKLDVEVVETMPETPLHSIAQACYSIGVTKQNLNNEIILSFGRAYLKQLRTVAESVDVMSILTPEKK